MAISDKSLNLSAVSVTVTANFSDLSLIPSEFLLNEIVKKESLRMSEIPLI